MIGKMIRAIRKLSQISKSILVPCFKLLFDIPVQKVDTGSENLVASVHLGETGSNKQVLGLVTWPRLPHTANSHNNCLIVNMFDASLS